MYAHSMFSRVFTVYDPSGNFELQPNDLLPFHLCFHPVAVRCQTRSQYFVLNTLFQVMLCKLSSCLIRAASAPLCSALRSVLSSRSSLANESADHPGTDNDQPCFFNMTKTRDRPGLSFAWQNAWFFHPGLIFIHREKTFVFELF